jgi:hypothetical protein
MHVETYPIQYYNSGRGQNYCPRIMRTTDKLVKYLCHLSKSYNILTFMIFMFCFLSKRCGFHLLPFWSTLITHRYMYSVSWKCKEHMSHLENNVDLLFATMCALSLTQMHILTHNTNRKKIARGRWTYWLNLCQNMLPACSNHFKKQNDHLAWFAPLCLQEHKTAYIRSQTSITGEIHNTITTNQNKHLPVLLLHDGSSIHSTSNFTCF